MISKGDADMFGSKAKVCVECKSYPVRQEGKHLCYVCFEKALRDLLRDEKGDRNENC